MRDAELVELYQAHRGPFPDGCGGVEINGIHLDVLDDAVFGVASHYLNNTRRLSRYHTSVLEEALADLEVVADKLPNDAARGFFEEGRLVATYLLDSRGAFDPD